MDKEIIEEFTKLMVEEAGKYQPPESKEGESVKVNKGTLAPFLFDKDFKEA